jgi:hypothetical protein
MDPLAKRIGSKLSELGQKIEGVGQPVDLTRKQNKQETTIAQHISEGTLLLLEDWDKRLESWALRKLIAAAPYLVISLVITLFAVFLTGVVTHQDGMSYFQSILLVMKASAATIFKMVGLGSVAFDLNLGALGTERASASKVASELWTLAWPVIGALLVSIPISFPLSKILMLWFNKKAINKSITETVNQRIRGARLVTVDEMNEIIQLTEEAGRQEAIKNGWKPIKSEIELTIGGVRCPYGFETTGILIVGSPGTGKTVLQKDILPQIRAAGHKMAVHDPAPEFIVTLMEEGDYVFSPYDARYPGDWDIFGELKSSYDAKNFATVLVPLPEKAEYIGRRGRRLLRELFMLTSSVEELMGVLHSDLFEIKEKVKGTKAESIIRTDMKGAPESAKVVEHLIDSLDVFNVIKSPKPGQKRFSFREWVSDPNDRRWVFLVNRADQKEILGPLYALIFEIIALELISSTPNDLLPEDQRRRVWINLEELGTSLPKIPSLELLPAQGRKYGLGIIATVQSIDQLEKDELYGKSGANAIVTCLKTWFIYGAAGWAAAEYLSNQIGMIEEDQKGSSTNVSAEEISGNRGWRSGIAERAAVMKEEIKALEVFHCYMLLPSLPAVKVRVGPENHVKKAVPNEAFIPSAAAKFIHPGLQGHGGAVIEGEAVVVDESVEALPSVAGVADAYPVPPERPEPPVQPSSIRPVAQSDEVVDLDMVLNGLLGESSSAKPAVEEVDPPPPPKEPEQLDDSWMDAFKP